MRTRWMMRMGLEQCAPSYKEAAFKLHITPSTLSKILAGERNLPPDIRPRAARMSLLVGLAQALEATEYSFLDYIDGDRHVQTMIRRVEKEDREADACLKELPWILLDKNSREDLTPEELEAVAVAFTELWEEARAIINLLVELDNRYRVWRDRQKEKAAKAAL